jgi:hypothetical protein
VSGVSGVSGVLVWVAVRRTALCGPDGNPFAGQRSRGIRGLGLSEIEGEVAGEIGERQFADAVQPLSTSA